MIEWTEDGFVLNDLRFHTMVKLGDWIGKDRGKGVVIAKSRRYVEKYVEYLAGEDIGNVFELGIMRGGSAIFFSELFQPRKLVAVDVGGARGNQLETYRRTLPAGRALVPHYGVDQADVGALRRILDAEFGDEPLDLVVDDASHYLEESRASFNCLFPRLRTGGAYVIEDWQWDHLPVCMEALDARFAGRPSLANLIVEIMLASVREPAIVEELTINNGLVLVRRGPAEVGADFDICAQGLVRGARAACMDRFAP